MLNVFLTGTGHKETIQTSVSRRMHHRHGTQKRKPASVDTPLPGLTDAGLVVLFNGAGSGMARDFHLATKGIITLSAPTSFS